jgi:E1A/CREB-binding protein
MIMQLQQQEEDGRNNALKKGKTKKAASSKRASKAVAQAEMASNASKDTQLMHKLGESILPMKEDFIMVHMHHACSHCRLFIVTGCRWVCGQCKNFQLCDRCHDAEQMLDEKERHPISSKDPHPLQPVLHYTRSTQLQLHL